MLFVTGATGFLGSEIVRQSIVQGIPIHASGRSHWSWPKEDCLRFTPMDLASDEIPANLLSQCDQVLHVAGLAHQFGKSGEDRSHFERVNVHAATKLAEAAGEAGVNQFILISSVGVYGQGEGVRPEDSPCEPMGYYATSKYRGELAVREVCDRYAMPLVILRMATLYGEGDRGNVQRLIEGIDGGRIPFFGAGENRKSLVHVQDAAAACLKVVQGFHGKSETKQRVFNVAGSPRIMRDVYREIRVGLGKSSRFLRIPMLLIRTPFQIIGALPRIGPLAQKVTGTLDKWARDDAYDGSKYELHFGSGPMMDLATGVHRQTRWYRLKHQSLAGKALVKRTFDLLLSTVLLVLFIIPMLAVAVLVKITSPGPIVYYSNRVGKDNQIFSMPKFRTMRIDTPQVATHLLGDSEKWLTPVGALLRKTSLDELPQLFSVLKGKMSFVGPRPALFNQNDLIDLRGEAGVSRLKPGITGWAQINGRDDLSLSEKVVFDQQYVLRRTLIHDMMIIFRTALQTVVGKGVRSAEQIDGISAWQLMRSATHQRVVIITEPQSALLVCQTIASLGWLVPVYSLRKDSAISLLIDGLAKEECKQILLVMPDQLLVNGVALEDSQAIKEGHCVLDQVPIIPASCWQNNSTTLARMDLQQKLQDHRFEGMGR